MWLVSSDNLYSNLQIIMICIGFKSLSLMEQIVEFTSLISRLLLEIIIVVVRIMSLYVTCTLMSQ